MGSKCYVEYEAILSNLTDSKNMGNHASGGPKGDTGGLPLLNIFGKICLPSLFFKVQAQCTNIDSIDKEEN